MHPLAVAVLTLALGLTLAGPYSLNSEVDYEEQTAPIPQIEEEEDNQETTPTDTSPERQSPQAGSEDMAEVELHYQNNWDGDLHVECGNGQGFYKFQSVHDNGKEDRRWRFDCKWPRVGVHTPASHCNWYQINSYDLPMLFMCPANQYMAGIWSRHHNGYEDRVWHAKCCSKTNHCTRNCRTTGFVNSWDGRLYYSTRGIFTGLLSFHDNGKEDRLFRVITCDMTPC